MKKNEDQLLFRQIQKKRKEAFDALFRKYYKRLVRFTMGYVRSGPMAEEVVQDVFIRLWEQSAKINIKLSLLAYLYTSTRNGALNQIKKEEVRARHEKEQSTKVIELEKARCEDIDLGAFNELIAKGVSELPEKCRQIFELIKFEGLSYEEVADFLEVSKKTVENQMGIALKKLREWMTPHMHLVYG